MTAHCVDGKALAAQVRSEVAADVQALKAEGVEPCLAVVLVGEDPASAVYVRNKVRACEDAGIRSIQEKLPAATQTAALVTFIQTLVARDDVHGILVQLPLPAHIDEEQVLHAIPPHKDVDGFDAYHVGRLSQNKSTIVPCTPAGVMRILAEENITLAGTEAVVIGRSNIVGKPMAMLLTNAGATVTLCHSKTQALEAHTCRADLIVIATGRAGMLRGDMIKPGATVIDVGINRTADGRLCGDVDFASAVEVAGVITPVPGGVGPMTIAMLLKNTVNAVRSQHMTAAP